MERLRLDKQKTGGETAREDPDRTHRTGQKTRDVTDLKEDEKDQRT